MALTAQEYIQLLLLEIGAGLDGSDPVEKQVLDKVTPNIQLIWSSWSDKALVFPRLQYLYAKKQCLDILEGQLRDLVSTTIGGFNANQQQRLDNLRTLNTRVGEEIKVLEAKHTANRPMVMAPLNQTAPRMDDPGKIDPNDPVYRGDAIIRPMLPNPYGQRRL
jgi:hypothetical protein